MKKFIQLLKIMSKIIIGVASVTAAIFVVLTYLDVQKDKNINQTPFFKYEYSKEKKGFEVISGDGFDIKNTRWILPMGHNYPAPAVESSLWEISENSTMLTINDLENALIRDLDSFLDTEIGQRQLYDLIRCRIFPLAASQYGDSLGLGLIVQIEYELKEKNIPSIATDLIHIKGLNTEFPVIKIIRHNASDDEINSFATDSVSRLYSVLNIISQNPSTEGLTDDGECLPFIGNPDLEQEYNNK